MTMATLPSEAIDATWRCPNCRKKLTHKSFGFENPQSEQTKWVGSDGKWTTKKPTEDFTIGSWYVYIRLPAPLW